MTVSYQYDVASSASGGFIRLLFRWRGSVWKVVYRDMLIFVACYVTLTLLYKFALTETQQQIFEKIVYFCSTFMDLIPLSFMLGFYVSFIAARWWSQFVAIPWPDKLMNIVAMYIPGLDEASRVVRRTMMRYVNLSLVLVLRSISMAVKRRFPTKEHLIEAGFMTKTELDMFQSVPSTEFNTFWIPCTWFINVLREARLECRITDSNGVKLIMEELNDFRSKCGLLWSYDWISIPLVYTQVVTMATYAFFVACMFGRQDVKSTNEPQLSGHRYDYYIPVFTLLQLMFYMGLLKVAEQLINPFGDDDEDFELNWIIDRHMKVSYLGVDTLNGTPPPLVRDTYYNELDVKIPYTEASRNYKKKTYRGSVAYMQVPMEQQGMVLPESEVSDDDGETVSESMGQRRPSVYNLFSGRGVKASPSGSFVNLDSASMDSDVRGSWLNISIDAKNSSGTLGATPVVVDMPKAEDDEIILQEVVIDPIVPVQLTMPKSRGSIQSTGSTGRRPSFLMTMIRDISPKIAPKFPREKLRSMFGKKKLRTAFQKIKGVRFTKSTKEDEERDTSDDESDSQLSLPQDELEIAMTTSNPELTDIEKKMGVHPYQEHIATPVLLMGALSTLAEKQKTRRATIDHSSKEGPLVPKKLAKSRSLPNFKDYGPQKMATKPKQEELYKSLEQPKTNKSRRPKKKRKSPPPPASGVQGDQSSDQDIGQTSDISPLQFRRNTLPLITVTRYDLRPTDQGLPSAAPTTTGSRKTEVETPDKKDVVPKTPLKSAMKEGGKTTATSSKKSEDSATKKPPIGSTSTTQSSKTHSVLQDPPPKSKPAQRTLSLGSAFKPFVRLRKTSPPETKEVLQDLPPKVPARRPTALKLGDVKLTSVSESVPSSPTESIPLIPRTYSLPQSSKIFPSPKLTAPNNGDTSEQPKTLTTFEEDETSSSDQDSPTNKTDNNNTRKGSPSQPHPRTKKGRKSKK